MDLAIIAQHALAQYDINAVSVSPVAQSGAAVFKIKNHHGLLYSLRVHKSKISTLETMWTRRDVLESEQVWLDALNRDTHLTLPVPKRNRLGSYVTQVDDISCTMLRWVEGEQKQYFTNDQDLKSTAVMTATLHQHASMWQPPSSFIRPTVHRERIQNALDLLKQQVREGLLDAHDVQILEAAGEKAMALLDTLPKNKLTWGVLHGDIVPPISCFQTGLPIPLTLARADSVLFSLTWPSHVPLFIPLPDNSTSIGTESTFRCPMSMWPKSKHYLFRSCSSG